MNSFLPRWTMWSQRLVIVLSVFAFGLLGTRSGARETASAPAISKDAISSGDEFEAARKNANQSSQR